VAALLRPNAAAEPFAGAVGLFVMMSHVGIAISLWPMIVPDRLALWRAGIAAAHAGLPAGGHIVPVAGDPEKYIVWSCRLFGGKLRVDIGCH